MPLPHLLLLQLPFQKLLLPARGLLRQLRLTLLLLSPGGKVAVVHILKIFGDRILIVAVCPHFLLRPVREVTILRKMGKKHRGETSLSGHTKQVGLWSGGQAGLDVWALVPCPALVTSLTFLSRLQSHHLETGPAPTRN